MMKLAYVTHYDIANPEQWHPKTIGVRSTSYHKAKALEKQFPAFQYIGPFPEKTSWPIKVKNRLYSRLFNQKYHGWADLTINRFYGKQINQAIADSDAEIILCPDVNSIAFLNCRQPIVLWSTNLYGTIIDSYPAFSQLCRETQQNLVKMDRLALERCDLAIFASQWAADYAIETYGFSPDKVRVAAYGANVMGDRTLTEIQGAIAARSQQQCELLFFGVNWQRKGGDIALQVAKMLNAKNIKTRLTIVGCRPPQSLDLPDFVNVVGFLSKGTEKGREKLQEILLRSHFLILPSQAETFGNVLCEANAFGLPCLATAVGGMTTIIAKGKNGQLFDLTASIADYCEYITSEFSDSHRYQALATSAFLEYRDRLNWQVAGQTVRDIILEFFPQFHAH